MQEWNDIMTPPPEDEYVLLSFSNFSVPLVGRFYDGAYYVGDDFEPAVKQDVFINGWQRLPKCKGDK